MKRALIALTGAALLLAPAGVAWAQTPQPTVTCAAADVAVAQSRGEVTTQAAVVVTAHGTLTDDVEAAQNAGEASYTLPGVTLDEQVAAAAAGVTDMEARDALSDNDAIALANLRTVVASALVLSDERAELAGLEADLAVAVAAADRQVCTGPAGVDGADGTDGEDGADGEDGLNGEDGEDGEDFDQVGTPPAGGVATGG